MSGSAYLRFFGRGVGEPSGGQFIASPSPGDDSPLALEDQDPIPRLLLSGALLTTVLVAWDPNPVVVRLKAQDASVVEVQGDQPPRVNTAGRSQIIDAWRVEPWSAQSAEHGLAWLAAQPFARAQVHIWSAWSESAWGAQRAAPNAAWNFVRVDAPPPLRRDASILTQAWQPSVTVVRLGGRAGSSVAAVDNPPPYRSPMRQVLAASEQRVVTLELRTAGAGALSVDNPPPLRRGANILAWAWQPSVTVVRLGGRAGSSVAAPAVSNPPIRRRAQHIAIEQWQPSGQWRQLSRFMPQPASILKVILTVSDGVVNTITLSDQAVASLTKSDSSVTNIDASDS